MGYSKKTLRESDSESPKTVTKYLAIEGMSCAACSARIETTLRSLTHIDDFSVNLATAQVRIRYSPCLISINEISQAIKSTGYVVQKTSNLPITSSESQKNNSGKLAFSAALLTVPVMLISMITPLRFPGWEWALLSLSCVIVLGTGRRFHYVALKNIRRLTTTMETLVSLGTLTTLFWSIVSLVAVENSHLYFEVGAMITTLILLGRYFEQGARRLAGSAVRQLLELEPQNVRVLDGSVEKTLPIEDLKPGDLFVVRPGERIPTDGEVVDGASAIDTSMLTGESVPIEVSPGKKVIGATVNTYGRLVARATKTGRETLLFQIAQYVAEAQSGKVQIQRLSDQVVRIFVPIVVIVSLTTLVAWLAITGSANQAFTAAIAVLIVACPCALGLATPTAILAGTGRGAQLGILIRNPESLERAGKVTTVVFDKTGTLTEGSLILTDIKPLNGTQRADVLRYAGAVELASEHPVGKAVSIAAKKEIGELPKVTKFRSLPGIGVEGSVEGQQVKIARTNKETTVSWGGIERARLAFRDSVKSSSATTVHELRKLSLKPMILSGDTVQATREISREVGIDNLAAEAMPHEKAKRIMEIQDRGEVVAMVGDGINDAPALAQADLGISLASGSDISIENSDITLLSDDLRIVPDTLRLAHRVLSTIKQNLFWAFAYNIVLIPLAIGGMLNPIIAAVTMTVSSLLVVCNSLRLRSFQGTVGESK